MLGLRHRYFGGRKQIKLQKTLHDYYHDDVIDFTEVESEE